MSRANDAQLIATLADALPLGIWVARAPDGEFVYANGMFKDIMGMGARDDVAAGQYAEPYAIRTRSGAAYPEAQMPFVRALTARDTVMVDDIAIHRPDGGQVFVRAYARPILESETVTHVVIAFFDITREVEAERARIESELRMRRAQRMEAIGKLAGGIAHDFNNILGVIRGIAGMLEMGEADPKRREDFEAIDAAIVSASQLTRGLLGFAGKGRNLSVALNVDDVVRSVTEIFRRSLDGRISLTVELEVDRAVRGDRSQLEQVVMNLLINAREAIGERGIIVVRSYAERGSVVFEVEDDGPGVAPQLRDRIFEPYVSTKTLEGQRGSGLGLATVFGIVDAHGGDIEVTEGAAGGALFRVKIPAAAALEDADSTEAYAPVAARAQVVGGTGLILIVDDEPALRAAAQRALETAGYRVLTASDGVEGVELFAAHRLEVALVLLDMSMPRLDGAGAFAAMRELHPQARVLITTGYALNDQAQDLLDRGAVGFLAKPYGVSELSAAVAGALLGTAQG